MIAGKLNEIITVEQPCRHENELGEVVENHYIKKFTTKAQVIYKSGVRTEDYSIQTDYSIQFVIRIYHDVKETDRIVFRNQYYRIESIEYSREYQLIKLNCSMINE